MVHTHRSVLVCVVGLLGSTAACVPSPCGADSDCPPAMYCAPQENLCRQECLVEAQCGAGRICAVNGQCTTAPAKLALELRSPAQGADRPQGTPFELGGRVRTSTLPVEVTLTGVDSLSCAGVPLHTLEVLPQPKAGWQDFSFPGLLPGEGGGTLTVTARTAKEELVQERGYASGFSCTDCPPLTLSWPPVDLPPLDQGLSVLLEGASGQGAQAVTLFAHHDSGQRVELVVPGGGPFSRVLPLWPGLTTVGVRAGAQQIRTCPRVVEAPTPPAGLVAQLGWDGTGANLDVLLVPPGATVGAGSCGVLHTAPACGEEETPDVDFPGPERVHVQTPVSGLWGVVVLVLPSAAPGVHALVSLSWDGVLLGHLGPRTLGGSGAQVWLVGRVEVSGDAPATFEPMDRASSDAPLGPPSTW